MRRKRGRPEGKSYRYTVKDYRDAVKRSPPNGEASVSNLLLPRLDTFLKVRVVFAKGEWVRRRAPWHQHSNQRGIQVMWQLRVGLIALLGLSAACGASRAPGTDAAVSPSDEIPVQIDNQNYSDMDIYVMKSG
jgi:hypothetical protein